MIHAENTFARFLKGLYPLGVMLALIPLVDWLVRVYPFFPGQVQWRFGAEVSLVATLGIVLTGLGLLGGVAAYSGHRIALRVLAVIAAAGALLATALLGLFLLDASQMRGGVSDPNMRAGMTKALISGSLTALMAVIVMVSLARGMWRVAASQEKKPESRSAMLIRQRGSAPSGGASADETPPT